MMEADADEDVRAPVGRTWNILENAVVFTPDFIAERLTMTAGARFFLQKSLKTKSYEERM